MPRHLANLNEFNEALKHHSRVIVDFTATWCGPCKFIGPKFDALQAKYPDIFFAKVDVDAAEGITSMPTFRTYHKGQKFGEMIGADERGLQALVEKLADSA